MSPKTHPDRPLRGAFPSFRPSRPPSSDPTPWFAPDRPDLGTDLHSASHRNPQVEVDIEPQPATRRATSSSRRTQRQAISTNNNDKRQLQAARASDKQRGQATSSEDKDEQRGQATINEDKQRGQATRTSTSNDDNQQGQARCVRSAEAAVAPK